MLHKYGCLLAIMTLAVACTGAPVRKPAPDFRLIDSNGAPVRLSSFKGKVVLLNFWATTCGGCKTEIPWFVEFSERYKQRGLSVIGVSLDDDGWKSVRPFLKEKKLNYTVVIGSDALANQYGVNEMPVTLLIGRDGQIAYSHTGVVDKSQCEEEIRSLLEEKRPG